MLLVSWATKSHGPLTIRKGVVNCELPGAAQHSGQAADGGVQQRQQQRPRLRARHLARCLLGRRRAALPLERQRTHHICDMRLCYCAPGTPSSVFMAPASMHGINVSSRECLPRGYQNFLMQAVLGCLDTARYSTVDVVRKQPNVVSWPACCSFGSYIAGPARRQPHRWGSSGTRRPPETLTCSARRPRPQTAAAERAAAPSGAALPATAPSGHRHHKAMACGGTLSPTLPLSSTFPAFEDKSLQL